jgi:hypothetical protein
MTLKRKKPTRGGYRPGSGAKPKAPGERRLRLSVSVAPATLKKIHELAVKEGLSLGVAVDFLVRKRTE